MATIANGKFVPINVKTGTIPDVGSAMRDWFQPMIFGRITKTTIGFQVVEVAIPVFFYGVVQPSSERELSLKPEGQRAWTWLTIHADPVLTLRVDDVIVYNCIQYRVMGRKNYTLYGYVEYSVVQDWNQAGPSLIAYDLNGGDASTEYCSSFEVDGGNAFTSNYALPDIDGGSA